MKSLKWLREQGGLMNQEEFERFVPLTIEESVAEFLAIYNTFSSMLDQVNDLDREQDEIYFTELASRLFRINGKNEQHAESIPQRRAIPEAS
jgi:hypothetical protein